MSERFGSWIRALRLKRGLTQRQVSERAGLDSTYLSKIENSRLPYTPSVDTLRQLARVLGVSELEMLQAPEVPPSALDALLKNRHVRQYFQRLREDGETAVLLAPGDPGPDRNALKQFLCALPGVRLVGSDDRPWSMESTPGNGPDTSIRGSEFGLMLLTRNAPGGQVSPEVIHQLGFLQARLGALRVLMIKSTKVTIPEPWVHLFPPTIEYWQEVDECFAAIGRAIQSNSAISALPFKEVTSEE